MTAQSATLSRQEWYEPRASESIGARPSYVSDDELTIDPREDDTTWNVRPRWLNDVANRVRRLQTLPEGWDGYGSSAVDRRLAAAVVRFLSDPIWAPTPRPHIVPTSDGGLAAEWRSAHATLEIEFDPTGSVDVYVSDDLTRVEWDGPLGEEPDGLAKWAWRVAAS